MTEPNPLGFLQNRRTDEKMEGVRALLSSDKNNETKTRIATVYGMTVFDALGAWASPTDKIQYKFENEEKTLPKSVAGLAQFFGMRYRINAISKDGLSRFEYVESLKSYLAQQEQVINQAAQARAEEGVKKVK